jgi:uncharacterized protein YaaW (UPF0174 family)
VEGAGVDSLPDDALIARLRSARRRDLDDLLGSLKLEAVTYRDQPDEDIVALISAHLRSAAGNSILNLKRRKHDFPYKQIVIDVADKLHPSKAKWTSYRLQGPETVEEIEDYIYTRIEARLSEWLRTMSHRERTGLSLRLEQEMRTKGIPEAAIGSALAAVLAGTVSGVALAGVVTPILLGTLWSSLFGLSLGSLILGGAAVGGPIGILVGAGVVVAGPGYSKTIPTVFRLIQIRRSAEERAKLDD